MLGADFLNSFFYCYNDVRKVRNISILSKKSNYLFLKSQIKDSKPLKKVSHSKSVNEGCSEN